VKIYFQGLIIYFQGMIIYFQALKIICLPAALGLFLWGGEEDDVL